MYFGPLSLMLDGRTAGYISNRDPSAQSDLPIVTGQKELLWHADGTQGIHPGVGTSLLAIEAAPESMPTRFANAVRASRHSRGIATPGRRSLFWEGQGGN